MNSVFWLFAATRRNRRSACSRSGCLGSARSSRLYPWLFLLASGCTVFYEPTYTPPDGGTDGQLEAGPDGGMDAGPDAVRTEINCEDGNDNDNDGLVDCNDYDCSHIAACCGEQNEDIEVNEPWDIVSRFANWDVKGATPVIERAGEMSFVGGRTAMRYVRDDDCVTADLGLFGYVQFKPRLSAGEGCEDDFASAGFTVASQPGSGPSYATEIRVTVNACGEYDVLRGNTSLLAGTYKPADPNQTINFAITPSTEGSEEVMRVTVTASGLAEQTVLVEGIAFIDRDKMLEPQGCADKGRGLRLVLEGQAASNPMKVGQVHFTAAQCANPGQFAAEELGGSAQFDVSDVNPTGTWAAGGLGSPTLEEESGDWQVLYDATPDPRQIAEFHPIDFAIGRSAATTIPSWDPSAGGAPISEPLDPPESCQAVNCMNEIKYRDPFVFGGVIAYTRDTPEGPQIGIEPYRHTRSSLQLGPPILTADDTRWTAEQPPVCPDGVSQPTFAKLPFNQQTEQYWLFFTCHSGDERSIAYQRVSDEGDNFVLSGTGGKIELVGKGGHAGTYALGGIESPEVIVEYGTAPNVVYRLWFIARDRGQRRSIGLAQWQPNGSEPPNFIPFPGNPVLQASDPEAMCGSGCKLESLAVARDQDKIRFLLAQSVNVFGEVSYQIVSLIQNWSRPQWPN